MAENLANGAEYLNARARWTEAQAMAEQSLAIWERELEPDHPNLAAPLTALGWSWARRGDRGRAVPSLERALRIREARDPDPAGLGETRFALAWALADGGPTKDRALALARQAREDYAKTGRKQDRVAEVDLWIAAHAPTAVEPSRPTQGRRPKAALASARSLSGR
jgi:tetratricopeptide (TPR) repeat protein